ncbi:MAG: hypothetical protein QNK23_07075 [Crocinitomicaceae bacterium]|nr:hypothetical protein [Crocinitomicaceae bacterium]
MRNILLTLGAVTLLWVSSNAQKESFGYLGKKNLISVFTTGNFRVFPAANFGPFDYGNGYETIKYDKNNQVKYGTKVFRYDIRLGYTRLIKKGFGIGAEFGYENYRMTGFTPSNYPFSSYASSPVFNVFSTMLTLNFTGRKQIAPTGFTTTLGIGPKFYVFDKSQNYRIDESTAIGNPYPDYKMDMMGLNLFWELGYRIPIAEFLVIDFGLRFNAGYTFRMSYDLDSGIPFTVPYWTKNDIHNQAAIENATTLMTFKLGFGFML